MRGDVHYLDVGQMSVHLFYRVHGGQDLDYDRQRLWPNFGQIALLRAGEGKGQGFAWRSEKSGHTGLVASRIDPVPAVLLKENRVQAMQTIWRAGRTHRQSLVAESGRDGVGPEQRGQQVTFGVAIAGAVEQDIGGLAGDGIFPVIPTVKDGIAHELIAALGNRFIGTGQTGKFLGLGQDCRMLPVDVFTAFKVRDHGRRWNNALLFVHSQHFA
jgi:hypothetical protein